MSIEHPYGPGEPAFDPVCGMAIGRVGAVASAFFDGECLYFCSADCHGAFLDTPHRYVGWPERVPRPRALVARGSRSRGREVRRPERSAAPVAR